MSELINLNDTTPAAASGFQLVKWQRSATPSGTDPTTGNPYFDVSAEAPLPISCVTLRVASGAVLTTGDTKTYPQVDFAGTILGWDITADAVGSVAIDVWKAASGGGLGTAPAIPTSANKISASAGPSLSTAQSASQNAAGLTGWTTAVAANDVFGFSIASATTVKAITLQIWIQRS